MGFYPDNPKVFAVIKRDYKKLIPFVGAGMSVPCYPLWANALKILAQDIFGETEKSEILAMLEETPPKLLEAAQGLEDCWGEYGMADQLLPLFSSSHLKKYRDELSKQSVWLLPYLFPDCSVVTTNFDRVLETVYQAQGKAFDTTILPGRQELHDQLHQSERHGLLKIHGDIGGETLEYSSIIFTQRQYDKAYRPKSSVVKDLQQWFSSKMLFFLGCSLDIDKTMELLQRIVALHKGITHYAIVECKDTKTIMTRVRELRNKLGIRVILYPKDQHESVRIILEKLLEEIDPKTYQTLDYCASALTLESSSTSFSYKAGITDFLGREAEMEQLRTFCLDSDDAFRWWAVTAPGGAGKSRLAYEFANEMKQKGWKVHWPQILDDDTLNTLNTTNADTLVIVDYVQAYAQQVGQWMEHLAGQKRACPIRILLLERDGSSLSNSSWGSVLQEKMGRANYAQSFCWKQEFLQLFPLQDEHLMEVMRQYARRKGKTLYSPNDTNLLDALKRIDPDSYRPLYALFIIDAWANGDEPKQWSREQILQYVLKREQDYFQQKCNSLLGRNVKLQAILQEIRVAATIWGDLTLEQLQIEYPDLWNRFQRQVECMNCVESEEDLLHQLGMYDGKMISALRPDLVGEYFVLTYIKKKTDKIHLLFLKNWGEKKKILEFLFRILLDYIKEVEQVDIFWKYFFQFNSIKVEHYYFYAMILVNIIAISQKYYDQAQKILEQEYKRWKNDFVIANIYAKGLFNLCNKQSEEAIQGIQKLESLNRRYAEEKDIVLAYAQSLVNFSDKQSEEKAIKSVEKLEQLSKQYAGEKDIALEYAKGLVNLTSRLPQEKAAKSVEKLEKLSEEYSGNKEIALEYAKSLFNLSYEQPVEEVKKNVNKLEQLSKEYEEEKEIVLVYAQGLFNLSTKQLVEEAVKSVEKLTELTEIYRDNDEIVLLYTFGQCALARKSLLKQRIRIIKQLLKVLKEHPKVENMFNETIRQKPRLMAAFAEMCAEVKNAR